MSDFIQTMKVWRRMCKFYYDKSMAEDQNCIDLCPLGHNTVCGAMGNALNGDIESAAKEVEKWAAEHPEPVYPTWYEWLANMGVVTSSDDLWMDLQQPIPADIAEKLGIEPKERQDS